MVAFGRGDDLSPSFAFHIGRTLADLRTVDIGRIEPTHFGRSLAAVEFCHQHVRKASVGRQRHLPADLADSHVNASIADAYCMIYAHIRVK